MVNKNSWRLLFNPFTRIAGWQAFGIGLIFVLISGILGAAGNFAFDGVLDAHLVPSLSLGKSFLLLTIDILAIVLMVCLGALIFKSDFRFIDVLGTLTLARAPYLILAIFGLFMPEVDHSAIMKDIASLRALLQSPVVIVFSIVIIPVVVWYITLTYNAIKVSCNMKGAKLTTVLILGIIIAEVISKIAIFKFTSLYDQLIDMIR